jgi:hypothetical protein
MMIVTATIGTRIMVTMVAIIATAAIMETVATMDMVITNPQLKY